MPAAECPCGKPTAGSFLCDRCSRTFSYALVNTAAYSLELDTVAGKQTRFGDTTGGSAAIGKTQPLPVDGRFLDRAAKGKGTKLRHDVDVTVASWTARLTTEQPPLNGPACDGTCLHTSCANIRRRRPPTGDTIPARVAYLARHLKWTLTQPWCTDMLADFLHLEHRLTRMVDRPPETWYAGKCSAPITIDDETYECDTELYARVDKGFIECRQCGTRHDVGQRREFMLAAAQDYHVTATEAAQALIAWTDYDGTENKLVDRIRKWRDRGKLQDVDMIPDLRNINRHLYRLGDIQTLLIEAAQQQQTKRVAAS